MTFKDHFSTQSATYAAARPHYPDALFAWLAGLPAQRECAWDAGCGSGQAAVALAAHFRRVVATDPSVGQIAHAERNGRVEYRVEPAESPTLADASVDLVTVAQALHWFEIGRFHEQARRVLRPDGAIAQWCYGLSRVAPAIDAVFMRLYEDLLAPYWPPERRHIESGYRELAFPFAAVVVPELAIEAHWTLPHYLDYLRSWSATQRYRDACGEDPVAQIADAMGAAWGDPDTRRIVRWPLTIRAGRP
ncbi:MAG TPA: class I SAM-dependent methyltransferase [Xanthomonadaceae bacterium]|nr:class I SAM-dependent methyltransferase [Xanthomonadaceae bacterium]